MTKDVEYKIARWLMKHGSVKRNEAPRWVPEKVHPGKSALFAVKPAHINGAGFWEPSPDDILYMSDRCKDAYAEEHARRKQEWRAEVTLWVAVVTLILTFISISWQIYTWKAERVHLPTPPALSSNIHTEPDAP